MNYIVVDTPLGALYVSESNEKVVSISLVQPVLGILAQSPILKHAKNQIEAYFNKELKSFDFDYEISGTDFQKKVYIETLKIPYGLKLTYKDIAINIGQPRAFRAVGGALNKNPLMLYVPCHRVIGQNNQLTGFASGVEHKKYLLNLEC